MKNKLVLSLLLLTSCTDPGPVKDSTITFEIPELLTKDKQRLKQEIKNIDNQH